VTLDAGARAIGKTLAEVGLEATGVKVRAVRRRGAKAKLTPAEAGQLEAEDVVVILGLPELLAAAEERLLRG
jgi:CPA2 family monovalent cation:H+ antiporter-2